MKNKKITKKVTKEKLVRIIKRGDIQSLLAIHEDQFDWEVLKQSLCLYIWECDRVVTLLEWVIRMGYVFKKEENLKRVVDDRGQTVAHIMAMEGYEFDPEKEKTLLCLADNTGQTVAHIMAKLGYKFDPDKHADIIRLADNRGWTVAHEMANQGYKFDPDRHREILLLTDSRGITVAHVMAESGYLFDPDRHGEICELKDGEGYSVLERFIMRNHGEILGGDMDQGFMRLSPKGIQKYMQAAERLKNGMHVYEYLEKILIRKELEKELGSLGLKL